MDKSRVFGVIICLAMVALGVLFLYGIATGSYWALAIPVIIGTFSVLALGFWIGWTMVFAEAEVPYLPPEETSPPSGSSESSS